MKKTITLLVLVLLTAMSQRAVAQNIIYIDDTIYPPYTPDTVIFGDSNYFYMPRYGELRGNANETQGANKPLIPHFTISSQPRNNGYYGTITTYRFYSDTTLPIYGIAWPMYNFANMVDVFFYLMQKNKLGEMVILDSIRMHRTATRKCYRFAGISSVDTTRISYQTLPLYEGYFEEMRTVTDTFYIGIADDCEGDPYPYSRYNVYYSPVFKGYLSFYCQHVQASPCTTNDIRDTLFMGGYARHGYITQLPEFADCAFPLMSGSIYIDSVGNHRSHAGGTLGTYPAMLPIIKPGAPYIDSVACHDTVKGFELYTQHDGIAGFTWDTLSSALWLLSRTTGYQVSCGPAENDIEDNEIRTLSGNRHVAGFTGLEPNREYKASIRVQCHHHCNAHDTTVWGAWQTPIHFTTGDTVSIALPEDAANDIMLLPNPADEQVTLRSTLPITHLTLCDLQGNILLSLTPQQNELTLPLHHYPQGTYLLSLTTQKGTTVKKLIRRQ